MANTPMTTTSIQIVSPISKQQQQLISLYCNELQPIKTSDSIASLKVFLENNSEATLYNSSISQAFLSYKIIEDDCITEGMRTAITRDVPSNSKLETEISINLANLHHKAQVQLCIVQEKIAWLNHIHAPLVTINLNPVKVSESAPFARNRPKLSKRPPMIYNFELTNRCPFSCIMCARTNNMTRPEGLMSFELFKKIIDQLDSYSVDKTKPMWLHGFGESLVHPEFDLFMKYASQKGFNVGLSINPFLLTKKIANRLLLSQPKHLYIAIDGHNNDSFEKIRGMKNAYDKSVQRLENFITLKNEISPNTKIDIGMIDFDLNHSSISSMGEKWKSIDKSVNFVAKAFTTWDGNASDVMALKKNRRVKPKSITCNEPWKDMTVNWDGKVTPCCFDYDKKYILGDLNTQSLSDVWNGQAMQTLRAEMISDHVTNPLCKNCEQL